MKEIPPHLPRTMTRLVVSGPEEALLDFYERYGHAPGRTDGAGRLPDGHYAVEVIWLQRAIRMAGACGCEAREDPPEGEKGVAR